jgi:hypothetical protein
MTATPPCYRHPRKVWILACPECTAWHLPAARARAYGDEVVIAPAAEPVADRPTAPPEATRVPPAHLRLVA